MKTKTENAPVRVDSQGFIKCRVCSCTEIRPCDPPCAWVHGEADLCTGCLLAAERLWEWLDGAHRPSIPALYREVKRMKRKPKHTGLRR